MPKADKIIIALLLSLVLIDVFGLYQNYLQTQLLSKGR